jgi:hypothetical protein
MHLVATLGNEHNVVAIGIYYNNLPLIATNFVVAIDPNPCSGRSKGRAPERGLKGRAPERRSKGGAPERGSKGGAPKRGSKGRAPECGSKGRAPEYGSNSF